MNIRKTGLFLALLCSVAGAAHADLVKPSTSTPPSPTPSPAPAPSPQNRLDRVVNPGSLTSSPQRPSSPGEVISNHPSTGTVAPQSSTGTVPRAVPEVVPQSPQR